MAAPPAPAPPLPALDAAVGRALTLLDTLTCPDGHGERLRAADIDAAAAVVFLESWRAGLGLVGGGGRGFLLAKVRARAAREGGDEGGWPAPPSACAHSHPCCTCEHWWKRVTPCRRVGMRAQRGREKKKRPPCVPKKNLTLPLSLSFHPTHTQLPGKRGWWSAPLAIRAVHLAIGASAGVRTTSALLTLDAAALARLMRAGSPALRASPGASLSVSCPCAGGTASRDDSFEFGLADADYRVPGGRGLMVDYSVGVSLLTRAPPAASAALLGGVVAGAGAPPPAGAAILSGAVPTPAALRPLCRALNAAAHLADRPAAPWPGV